MPEFFFFSLLAVQLCSEHMALARHLSLMSVIFLPLRFENFINVVDAPVLRVFLCSRVECV